MVFGKVQSAVAPFLSKSIQIGKYILTGNTLSWNTMQHWLASLWQC